MKLFPGKLRLTVPLSRHVRVYANALLLKVFECVARWQLCKETAGLVFLPQCDSAGLMGKWNRLQQTGSPFRETCGFF